MLYLRVNLFKTYNKIVQHYSTQTGVSNTAVKYTNTINLPKTSFPLRLSAAKRLGVEQKIMNASLGKLYRWQYANLSEPEFVLHDGPPYANGDLHMGHAINKILKDIIVKDNITRGRKVHYIPGWDCHGLPIELKAIKNQNSVKDAPTIRKIARQFALQTLEKQKTAFCNWGVTGDWTSTANTYRTLDPQYIRNEIEIFYDLYRKGLISRALKPVYWSPSSRTALAEAELEYNTEFESPSAYVRLEMNGIPNEISTVMQNYDKLYGIVWTTTPWTLPSNQAVCYNEDLDYSLVKFDSDRNLYIITSELVKDVAETLQKGYEKIFEFSGKLLANATYHHPFYRNEILPCLNGPHVQATKGTGLVHTAPAHGPDDFLVSLKYNIATKCMVDENGRYTVEAPEFLVGKQVLAEGNSVVLDKIRSDVMHAGTMKHSYPIDWRTKQPVIFRASEQWFINTEALKDTAIGLVENEIQFYPKITADIYKRNLTTQIRKRPYWCISRQRSWGVPIPVFYSKRDGKILLNDKIVNRVIEAVEKSGGIDFWWSDDKILTNDDLDEFGLCVDEVDRGRDIFDIWFDSGISWSNVLKGDRIADLYLEGLDQCTGWFQSSLLTSVAARSVSPYKALFVHGFAVDENGHKMSKSLGNVISPNDIVKKYGTDTLRWWVAAHAVQHTHIAVSSNLLDSSAESLHKIRSVLKYMLGVVERSAKSESSALDETLLTELDKSILYGTAQFSDQLAALYSQYQFNRGTVAIINFITNDVSSSYLHLIKDRLYCGSQREYKNLEIIMTHIFSTLCKHIWPIAPFLVEELWAYYDNVAFYERTPVLNMPHIQDYKESSVIIAKIAELSRLVNQNSNGQNTWTLKAEILCSSQTFELLQQKVHATEESNSSELCELLQVAQVKLVENNDGNEFDVTLVPCTKEVCPRCRRFKLDEADNAVCKRCDGVLKEKSADSLVSMKA